VSWESDPITGEVRYVERRQPMPQFHTLTEEELREEMARAERAAQIEREREDCLLRFGIKRGPYD